MTDGTLINIKRDKDNGEIEAKVTVENGNGIDKGDTVTLDISDMSLVVKSVKVKGDGPAELELEGIGPGTITINQ